MMHKNALTTPMPGGTLAAPADRFGPSAGARTLIESTCAQLRSDIIEGRLRPDEKLRVEHLKDRYGVGAGTLREAITRLVSDALVIAEGQRGFRVAPMTLKDLEDLTQLRVQLEIGALRDSMRQSDGAWRAALSRIYDAMSAYEQPILATERPRWEELNAAFHALLLERCSSPWTLRTLRLLAHHGERYRRCAIGINLGQRDVHAEHQAIFEAALDGNELRAALALEAHLSATPDLIKAAMRKGIDVFQAPAFERTPESRRLPRPTGWP